MRQDVVFFFISVLFVLVILGLVHIQILQHDLYFSQSQNNFIRILPIEAPRGRIFDRNGQVLVSNRISFDVACIYQELGRKDLFIKKMSAFLGMPSKEIVKKLERARQTPFAPVAIAEDVTKEKAIALEETEGDARGLVIETKSKRDYVYGPAASHLFGYLGEINEDELEALRGYGYKMRDKIGRSGIERQFNNYLMGQGGGEQIEVNARGRRLDILGVRDPVPGKDLKLTIDIRLQLLADSLLGKKVGAVVVMDPRDGQILALASHPSYDPNTFVNPQDREERIRLLRNHAKPLLNRAICGEYAPGSVFKIVTASAALDSKKIGLHTSFVCNGVYHTAGVKGPRCWKAGGHGVQSLYNGIKNSCNVYFCNIGRLAGVDLLEAYSIKFGYGKPTGVDLPMEVSGLVPGRLWKRIKRKDAWYEGETLNYSIGQGYLLVTPLQVARMTAAVANGGKLVRPYIVRDIGSVEVGGARPQDIEIPASVLSFVREGLRMVVNDDSGTGKRARLDGVVVAGKTGTAQNPRGIPHAWFTGYAPFNRPTIVVTVLIEHGGHGGVEPAEISHDLLESARQLGYL